MPHKIIPNAPELLSPEQRAHLKRQERERTIVRGLIRALKSHGFHVSKVYDGEEMQAVRTEAEALEAVFSVDQSALLFVTEPQNPKAYRYSVTLVAGEGNDIIADHTDKPEFTPFVDEYMTEAGLI